MDETIKKFTNKIWLSSPTMHGEELEYLTKAYESNWMSTVGENINQIEEMIAEKVGCKYAVALYSGTAAVHMAIKLADIKPDDKVFVSDLTFGATINPIVYEGGIPVFIDSEYETWNMDPVALERAFKLYPEVKVVEVAHLYGTPAKMSEIRELCDEYGATLVEDAAESLGATYKGIQTGALGKYNCISFNGNKIITGSSGGMLLTDEKNSADKVRKWSTQAKENVPWYQHKEIGYNYRMSNVIAGVVRGQMPYLDEHITRKKEIYRRYEEGFNGIPVQMNPFDKKNSSPNFWLSCMIINQQAMCEQMRDEKGATYKSEVGKSCPTEILQALSQYNAEGRPVWKPMHLQPIYENCDFVKSSEDSIDVGNDIFDRGLCLPSDIKMTEEQQDIIIEIVKSCFR